MTIEPVTGIDGVFRHRLVRHEDERGWFSEILREQSFATSFVQANHSHSRAGVLRGLHFHARQADAWYVIGGRARVGLADLRSDTPKAATIDLSADEPAVLFIPPGVAHGFAALTELDLVYFVTHYYDDTDEFGVAWDDPTVAVPWGVEEPILSDRDRNGPPFDGPEIRRVLGRVSEA